MQFSLTMSQRSKLRKIKVVLRENLDTLFDIRTMAEEINLFPYPQINFSYFYYLDWKTRGFYQCKI